MTADVYGSPYTVLYADPSLAFVFVAGPT